MAMTYIPEIGAEDRYQKNSVPNCMSDTAETGTGFLRPVFGVDFVTDSRDQSNTSPADAERTTLTCID